MRVWAIVAGVFCTLWAGSPASVALAEPLTGSGAFHMDDGRGRLAAPLRVFFHRPDGFKPNGPIVIIIHGMGRTAARYRDRWVDSAERHGVLILAPEFTREHYPGSRQFNLGNMRERDGTARPRSEWSFPVVDRVFHAAQEKFAARRARYHLFGHSAGAQFVHRLILFAPSPHLDRAIAANAGWYTLPVPQEAFPYGLGGMSVAPETLKQALGRRLTILLGTDDDDPNHRSLRRAAEAMGQGPHRLARGHHFFRTATRAARRLGVSFAWELREVPGVAHSGRLMSAAAARYLFEAR